MEKYSAFVPTSAGESDYGGATGAVLVVDYEMSGSAENGETYATLSGSVTFGAADSNVVVVVSPTNNWLSISRNATLTLLPGNYNLSEPTNATVTINATLPMPGGGTNTWLGGSSANNAADWSLAHVPLSTEHVLLSGWAGPDDMDWSADLTDTVASWTQDTNFTGNVTFNMRYPGVGSYTNLHVTGDVNFIGGSNWTYPEQPDTETATYRLSMTVGGNFELGSNRTVALDNLGYDAQKGPGRNTNDRDGASHGGRGRPQDEATAATYGAILHPTELGSGSYSYDGGGALLLLVTGDTQIDGTHSRPRDRRQFVVAPQRQHHHHLE